MESKVAALVVQETWHLIFHLTDANISLNEFIRRDSIEKTHLSVTQLPFLYYSLL
ncbi:unnamed protein product [Spirodela intermedia]|uniref:Uncharacterized protein n=1 Tax=Spirodela intermedia TaxID=51605 RepID=A0A7I8LCB0_SPIIN|nr:unnamed protein product [Spirodela intermedia]